MERLSLTHEQTPTFVAFKGGEKIGEVIGANPLALQVRFSGSYHDYSRLIV